MSCEHFVNLCFELISAAVDLAPHQNVAKFNKRRAGAKSNIYGIVMKIGDVTCKANEKAVLVPGYSFCLCPFIF